LLSLPPGESRLVLDVGCGSGLSGDALVEAGHEWVGLDISSAMVGVAVERGCGAGGGGGGDMLLGDMGQGFGFRAGVFDGAISVSALQWLCYSDRRDHRSARRLDRSARCRDTSPCRP
jgi:18S rRNA (guanine1575-N7)-methyltransferase